MVFAASVRRSVGLARVVGLAGSKLQNPFICLLLPQGNQERQIPHAFNSTRKARKRTLCQYPNRDRGLFVCFCFFWRLRDCFDERLFFIKEGAFTSQEYWSSRDHLVLCESSAALQTFYYMKNKGFQKPRNAKRMNFEIYLRLYPAQYCTYIPASYIIKLSTMRSFIPVWNQSRTASSMASIIVTDNTTPWQRIGTEY